MNHAPIRRLLLLMSILAALLIAGRSQAAGFTDDEKIALNSAKMSIAEALTGYGSTVLIWKKVVEGKAITLDEITAASTDIRRLRDARDRFAWDEFYKALVMDKRANCGEHAEFLQAILKHFQQVAMWTGRSLFSGIYQAYLAPGDHAFVVVTSADKAAVAIVDSWSGLTAFYTADDFSKAVATSDFISKLYIGNNYVDNPYVKKDSMLRLSGDEMYWSTVEGESGHMKMFTGVFNLTRFFTEHVTWK